MIQAPNLHTFDCKLLADLTQLQSEVAELVELVEFEKYQEKLQQYQQQNLLQKKMAEGVEKLVSQAERINSIATHLEAEIFQFQEIAFKVNQAYHAIQQPLELKVTGLKELKRFRCRPLNIWEVHSSAIPIVVRHGDRFILTAKTVDVFKAERKVIAQNDV